MCIVQPTIYLAQKVGAHMERGPLLLGEVPQATNGQGPVTSGNPCNCHFASPIPGIYHLVPPPTPIRATLYRFGRSAPQELVDKVRSWSIVAAFAARSLAWIDFLVRVGRVAAFREPALFRR